MGTTETVLLKVLPLPKGWRGRLAAPVSGTKGGMWRAALADRGISHHLSLQYPWGPCCSHLLRKKKIEVIRTVFFSWANGWYKVLRSLQEGQSCLFRMQMRLKHASSNNSGYYLAITDIWFRSLKVGSNFTHSPMSQCLGSFSFPSEV